MSLIDAFSPSRYHRFSLCCNIKIVICQKTSVYRPSIKPIHDIIIATTLHFTPLAFVSKQDELFKKL